MSQLIDQTLFHFSAISLSLSLSLSPTLFFYLSLLFSFISFHFHFILPFFFLFFFNIAFDYFPKSFSFSFSFSLFLLRRWLVCQTHRLWSSPARLFESQLVFNTLRTRASKLRPITERLRSVGFYEQLPIVRPSDVTIIHCLVKDILYICICVLAHVCNLLNLGGYKWM